MLGNFKDVKNNPLPSHNKNLQINLNPKNDLPDESFNNILKIYADLVDNDTENDAEYEKDHKRNQFQSITFGTLGTIDTDHFERDFVRRKRSIKDFYERAFHIRKIQKEYRDRGIPEIENVFLFETEQVHFEKEETFPTNRSQKSSEISIFVSASPEKTNDRALQRGNAGVISTGNVLQPLENFERSASTSSCRQ